MKSTTPTRKKARPGSAATAAQPRTAAELDAALVVIEARAPGLRKAGATRIVLGDVDVRLAPPPPPPAPAADASPGDQDEDGPEDLLAAYRGRDRARGAAARAGGTS